MLKVVEFGLLAGVLAVVLALIVTSNRSRSNPSEAPPPPSEDTAGKKPETAP